METLKILINSSSDKSSDSQKCINDTLLLLTEEIDNLDKKGKLLANKQKGESAYLEQLINEVNKLNSTQFSFSHKKILRQIEGHE